MMKKQLLLLVSLFSFSPLSQAVSINEHGLGEVLLFPFYTAASGNDTLINLRNETNQVKAVKLFILEGMNGEEVLEMALYLSPFDHWSVVITADNEGATIRTQDTSCTLPSIPPAGRALTDVFFNADSVNDLSRTREGYVKVIEMGVVTDGANNLAAAATHLNGTPADCTALAAAWADNGVWQTDPTTDMAPISGGLSGYGVLLNVNQGTSASYNATALSGFATGAILHAMPGLPQPTLNDADPIAKFIDNDTFYSINTATGLDAVSALFMADTLSNDFVLEPTINAGTDFVLTFPTKHDYVNGQIDGVGEPVALAPFSQPWDASASQACEQIEFTYYNREILQESPFTNLFGEEALPRPRSFFAFCTETAIFSFNNADVLGAQESGGNIAFNWNLILGIENGWMNLDFSENLDPEVVTGPRELVATGHTLSGLPVIGFAIQKYVNSTLIVDGQTVLSNYAGAVPHHISRRIF